MKINININNNIDLSNRKIMNINYNINLYHIIIIKKWILIIIFTYII